MIERYSFFAYSGCSGTSDFGSVTLSSAFFTASSISFVRRMIQTGLPRHSTTCSSPGARFEMSASTGAPAALARSEGHQLQANGTATRDARRAADRAGRDDQVAPRVIDLFFAHVRLLEEMRDGLERGSAILS